jgi:membrane AbrB-like protein
MPNAFMIGPLLATIAITASGVETSSMPTPLSNAGQVLLACALGSRFQQSFVRHAPRFVAALIPSVLLTLALAGLLALLLSWVSGVYLGTMLLACSPGGIAEMSITAKVLKIGVPLVTAAHVTRFVIVVLLTVPMYRLIAKERRG